MSTQIAQCGGSRASFWGIWYEHSTNTYYVTTVHGGSDGYLSFEWSNNKYFFRPAELRGLVLKHTGLTILDTDKIVINPCYPAEALKRYSTELTSSNIEIVGNWNESTIHYINASETRMCVVPTSTYNKLQQNKHDGTIIGLSIHISKKYYKADLVCCILNKIRLDVENGCVKNTNGFYVLYAGTYYIVRFHTTKHDNIELSVFSTSPTYEKIFLDYICSTARTEDEARIKLYISKLEEVIKIKPTKLVLF